MDSIKGAILLRDRLDRAGNAEAPALGAAATPDALPMFHWVTNEPWPEAADSNDAA